MALAVIVGYQAIRLTLSIIDSVSVEEVYQIKPTIQRSGTLDDH